MGVRLSLFLFLVEEVSEWHVAEFLENGVLTSMQHGLIDLIRESQVANEYQGLMQEFLHIIISVNVGLCVGQDKVKQVIELFIGVHKH